MKRLIASLFILFIISCSEDPVIYTLTATANPAEGGSVSPSSQQYDSGDVATVTATPSAEYVFQSWSGSASGSSPSTTVTMNSDKAVVANFVKKKYALTVNVEGEGSVTEKVIKAGVATDYNSGTVVELTAVPEGEWLFVEWKGDLTGSENPKEITIDKAKTVTAVFVKKQYPLTIEIEGEGTVSEKVIKQGLATDYNSGTIVELTAIGQTGWNFKEWQGDLTGSDNPIQVTIDKAKTLKAVFEEEDKVWIRLIPSYEDGTHDATLKHPMLISNSKYDTIASIKWEIYDKWGQGVTWNRTSTQFGAGTSGEWALNTYKNSDVKVSVKFPQNRAYELKGWGDNLDSNELIIEFKAENNILLEPRFEPIKHTIPNDEVRLYLSSTCRNGKGGGAFGISEFFAPSITCTGLKNVMVGYDSYNDQVPIVNLYDVGYISFGGAFGKIYKKEYEGMFLEYMKDLEKIWFGQNSNEVITDFDGSIYPKLKELSIENLKSIDLSTNTNLESLILFSSAELNELNLSNNLKLVNLSLQNINIQNLNLSGLSELNEIDFENLILESLNFKDSNKITYLEIHNLTNLKSITFAENETTVRMMISNTILEDLDLSPNKELKRLDLKDSKLEILDLSNNKDLKDLYAEDCENLKCVIASQYQLDNPGNYNWNLPDGVEIKLSCN